MRTVIQTLIAAATMSKGSRVTLDSAGKVVLAGATTTAIGTLDADATNGLKCAVILWGPVREFISGSAIALGDAISVAASGKVATAGSASTGKWRALDAASGADKIIRGVPSEY